jgi:hypothetical protein
VCVRARVRMYVRERERIKRMRFVKAFCNTVKLLEASSASGSLDLSMLFLVVVVENLVIKR